MSALLFTHILRCYFLFPFFSTIGFISIYDKALATSCQVYPSEYAYEEESVGEHESPSANCRLYQSGLQSKVDTSEYSHCNGTQLKLTDSDLGQEQYQSTDYYVWSGRRDELLLFIFPTRVSLTTITLHYYSDSVRGLPRLIFYAVPDDFDVWDAPRTRYPHVDIASVPPGRQPADHRNVSINVNFNTKRVLMYKSSSNFVFSVSEVEFFICTHAPTTEAIPTTSHQPFIAATSTSSVTTHLTVLVTTENSSTINAESFGFIEDGSHRTRTQSSSIYQNRSNSRTREIVAWVLIVLLVVLLIVSLAIHVIQAIWTYRIYKRNKNADTNLSPDCALAMDSNPCYEASNVKQTEAQEAVHAYDTVKQHS